MKFEIYERDQWPNFSQESLTGKVKSTIKYCNIRGTKFSDCVDSKKKYSKIAYGYLDDKLKEDEDMLKSKRKLDWEFNGPESEYNYDINFLFNKFYLSKDLGVIVLRNISRMPSLSGFVNLQFLHLRNISNINEILTQFSYVENKEIITDLFIQNCECKPKDAPLVFDHLSNLSNLQIKQCWEIQKISGLNTFYLSELVIESVSSDIEIESGLRVSEEPKN